MKAARRVALMGLMSLAGGLLLAVPRPLPASSEAVAATSSEGLETNLCTEGLVMGDPRVGPSWNGWGNGPTNTRFQPKSQGKLTADDLHRLQLKWAFGYANGSSARPQPTIAGGRLFAASDNGHVYALNPRTGCRYWTYKARAGIPTAAIVGRYRTADGGDGVAVFFGDRKANAYAVDAQTGRQIWVRKVDSHPAAAITGSLAFDGVRVFVPIQGLNEEDNSGLTSLPCCTFRGSLSALDASTGTVIWKTYTVAESMPRPSNRDGTLSYGPAGGGIWSIPTIDSKRRLVYVSTGNGYAEPAQPSTDAVLAMDINTGELKWSRQVPPGDAPNVPPELGPDFDLSAPPVLTTLQGRSLLLVLQKSGIARALDPAQDGAIVWQYRFGQGSSSGGQWGMAVEGETAYVGVADLLTPAPGGMRALALADGHLIWDKPPPPRLCVVRQGCNAGQGGPVTAIPGAVLSGGMDGGLRAYSAKDGAILWSFDTNREFDTVNGLKVSGGSMDSDGPVVVDGMVYVSSGSGGLPGRPGNVLLAFGLP
ncbi:MAG TPA: PQQ-binding-like beta-propeller repeat protein [Steroidobacteraceae bacterium]